MSKKHKGGKVAATRNGFDTLAQEFVKQHHVSEAGSKTQLELAMQIAEKTNNKPEALTAARDALKEAYKADGCAPKTASVYTSEALRICKAYYLTVEVKVEGDEKAKRISGKEAMQGRGYNSAKKLASQILAVNNHKSNAGRKAKGKAGSKPLDRAGIIDMLDQVIASARTMSGFDKQFLDTLIKARQVALPGKTNGEKANATATRNRVKVYAADVLAGKAKRSDLSVGQKAALTRRLNAAKANRIVEQHVH